MFWFFVSGVFKTFKAVYYSLSSFFVAKFIWIPSININKKSMPICELYVCPTATLCHIICYTSIPRIYAVTICKMYKFLDLPRNIIYLMLYAISWYGKSLWEISMQICLGKVTTLHLYQGAFVDIGGVYDG